MLSIHVDLTSAQTSVSESISVTEHYLSSIGIISQRNVETTQVHINNQKLCTVFTGGMIVRSYLHQTSVATQP